MTDLIATIAALRRPGLLIRTAKNGLTDYNRTRDLRRLCATADTPAPEAAIRRLLQEEDRIETSRRSGDASYSMSRHIELLIAMMCEAAILSHRQPV